MCKVHYLSFTFHIQKFNCYKYHWSDNRVPVILAVNQGSLDQIDPSSNRVLCFLRLQGYGRLSKGNVTVLKSFIHTVVQDRMTIRMVYYLVANCIELHQQVKDYPGGVAVIHGGFSRLVSILKHAIAAIFVAICISYYTILILILKRRSSIPLLFIWCRNLNEYPFAAPVCLGTKRWLNKMHTRSSCQLCGHSHKAEKRSHHIRPIPT